MKLILAPALTCLAILAGLATFMGNIPFIPHSEEIVSEIYRKDKGDPLDVVAIFSAEDPKLEGRAAQEKIALLANILHAKYPEVAIAGKYDRNLITQTDYVEYEVTLRLTQARGTTEFKQIEEKRKRIVGELAIATVRLLSAETNIPKIGANILHDMSIIVTATYVSVPGDENKAGEFFAPGAVIQEAAEKWVHLFDIRGMTGLLHEEDVMQWERHQVPKPHVPSIPNTGPVQDPKFSPANR